MRIVHPEMFANDTLPGWLFETYSILILLGLASYVLAFGCRAITSAPRSWDIFYITVGPGFVFKFKGMPPIVYYALTLVIGITLGLSLQ